MVRGFVRFSEWFSGFEECYVLIGGTAAYLVQQEADLEPRATQDLDIVLCVESLSAEFGRSLWSFIAEGGYEVRQVGERPRQFYRFSRPSDESFPKMLEFFSREIDLLPPADQGSHLTPVPIDESVVSLSAILLDEDYYAVIHAHKRNIGGVPIVNERALIPLKVRAWLDLSQRKAHGETVDSRDVKKHLGDVFRLYRLLAPDETISLPDTVREDVRAFLDANAGRIDAGYLKKMGIQDETPEQVLEQLAVIFGVLSR